MRAAIIRQTALSFRPDLFLVDKEPLGLKGEVVATLRDAEGAWGRPSCSGLRDIMDEPKLLFREWQRKHVLPALEHLYDEIWVYGLESFADPLDGVAVSAGRAPEDRLHGLPAARGAAADRHAARSRSAEQPYVLVTVGGGDDGMSVVDWVLRAYEHDPGIPLAAVIVLGPFMPPAMQRAVPRARRAPGAHRRRDVRHARRAADGAARSASWRWAATTRSARSCRSTSARSSSRGSSPGGSSCCARSAPPRWGSCARSIREGDHDPAGDGGRVARARRSSRLPSRTRRRADAGRSRRHHRPRRGRTSGGRRSRKAHVAGT